MWNSIVKSLIVERLSAINIAKGLKCYSIFDYSSFAYRCRGSYLGIVFGEPEGRMELVRWCCVVQYRVESGSHL